MTSLGHDSPLSRMDVLVRDRRLSQLEIPGADPDGDRRALELRARRDAAALERRRNALAIRRETLELDREARIEKQEAAMGWIQVAAVALLIPALLVVIALVALGEARPWALGPLLVAACGGAALPIAKLLSTSAKTEGQS